MLGTHWKGFACPDGTVSCVPSILDAIVSVNNATPGGSVTYSKGSGLTSANPSEIEAAVDAARHVDTIVIVLGIDDSIEHEGHDRDSIDLPDIQHKLSGALLALNKTTIIILFV